VRVGIYGLETDVSVTKPMSLFLSKDLTWNTALDPSGTMPQNGVPLRRAADGRGL
jgi:hypothetical protein